MTVVVNDDTVLTHATCVNEMNIKYLIIRNLH